MNPRLQGEHRSGRPGHMILAGLTLWLLAGACSPSATLEPTAHVDSTWERVQSKGRIIVGTTGDYAPFEYYNAEYRLDGFDVALIREVAERLGLRVELHDYAFDGLGAALAIGQVDAVIAAISVTDEREALVDFTDVYHVDKGVVVTREGSAMGPVSSVPDLARYRVGVEAGSVFQADLERLVSAGEMPSNQVHFYATAAEGTADLLRGKLDLLVLDEAAAKALLAQGGLEIAGEGLGTRRYAIAIPQGAATLQSELNRALRELAEDGTLAQLSERYLGAPSEPLHPLPTSTPGATPTPPGMGCLDASARIGELAYDDDEMRNPPQIENDTPFSKGWRLRNVGTCTWTEEYALRYVHGNRAEAKLLGGLGPCGRELCCSSFLPDFAAVSVKMAKEQNLPLNPTKISGICGRLMCCLTYEYETYQELKKDFPKIGKTIPSPLGPVKVLRQNIMDGTIVVETEDREEKILQVAELCQKAAPVKKEKG